MHRPIFGKLEVGHTRGPNTEPTAEATHLRFMLCSVFLVRKQTQNRHLRNREGQPPVLHRVARSDHFRDRVLLAQQGIQRHNFHGSTQIPHPLRNQIPLFGLDLARHPRPNRAHRWASRIHSIHPRMEAQIPQAHNHEGVPLEPKVSLLR